MTQPYIPMLRTFLIVVQDSFFITSHDTIRKWVLFVAQNIESLTNVNICADLSNPKLTTFQCALFTPSTSTVWLLFEMGQLVRRHYFRLPKANRYVSYFRMTIFSLIYLESILHSSFFLWHTKHLFSEPFQ